MLPEFAAVAPSHLVWLFGNDMDSQENWRENWNVHRWNRRRTFPTCSGASRSGGNMLQRCFPS
jgi:hypothetical protein